MNDGISSEIWFFADTNNQDEQLYEVLATQAPRHSLPTLVKAGLLEPDNPLRPTTTGQAVLQQLITSKGLLPLEVIDLICTKLQEPCNSRRQPTKLSATTWEHWWRIHLCQNSPGLRRGLSNPDIYFHLQIAPPDGGPEEILLVGATDQDLHDQNFALLSPWWSQEAEASEGLIECLQTYQKEIREFLQTT